MLKALQWALGVNDKLVGQVNLALLAAPLLNDGGSITLTTGVLAQEPIRHGASAAMVNAAIEGFVRAAAIELPRCIGFQPPGSKVRGPAPCIGWHDHARHIGREAPDQVIFPREHVGLFF